jgi:hypothetical protein
MAVSGAWNPAIGGRGRLSLGQLKASLKPNHPSRIPARVYLAGGPGFPVVHALDQDARILLSERTAKVDGDEARQDRADQ